MWEFAAKGRSVMVKGGVRRISKRRWKLWESPLLRFPQFPRLRHFHTSFSGFLRIARSS